MGESVFLNAVLGCVFFVGGGMMDTNEFLNDTMVA